MPTGIYKRTEECKKHLSEALKGRIAWNKGLKRWWDSPSFPKGHIPWNKNKKGVMPTPWNKGKRYKGKLHTKEWTEKVRQALIKRADRIGRKKQLRPKHNSHWKYREWRTSVYERNNYKCWICGDTNLNAHHLKSWAKYPKLRYKVTNGLTLCEFCHKIYA